MKLFYTEVIKLKNTFALWLTIVGALLVPLLLFTTYMYDTKSFIPSSGINPWNDYLIRTFNGCCFFALGFILLIIGLLLNIEHKASSWKHLFTMPVSRGRLYFGKLLLIFTLISIFVVLYFIFTLTIGYLLSATHPQLGFTHYGVPAGYIFRFLLNFIVSILPMILIQYWLSFRVENLVVSLAIGLVGTLMGLLLKNWNHIIYLPYATPFQMLNYQLTDGLNRENFYWINTGYSLLLLILSYTDFTKRFYR